MNIVVGMGEKIIVQNRKARHDYEVLDRHEAGIALLGTEVKSLRVNGSMTLKDSYADFQAGQLILVGTHIRPYDQGNINNHDPERPRKLLMHRHEMTRIKQRVEEKGLTLIPLRVYFKNGIVKVEIGVCRGKRQYDKRETIKERESKREVDRAIKSVRHS